MESDLLAAARLGLKTADRVTVCFITASGHKDAEVRFVVDNYRTRRKDGSIDEYLQQCAIPRLKRDWHPIFTEVARYVEPLVLVNGTYEPRPEPDSWLA